MIKKNDLKDFFILAFTTKRIDNVWKYPHVWRAQWLLILPGYLGIAYYNNILDVSFIVLTIFTVFYKVMTNYYASKSDNPIKTEKFFMYMDSVFFGLWSGLLGFYVPVVLLSISLILCPILYYGLKRLYINLALYFLSGWLAWFYGNFSHEMFFAYGVRENPWDYWLFVIAMLQYVTISILIKYTMKSTKVLETAEEKNILIKNKITSMCKKDIELLQDHELVNTVSALGKEKFNIQAMLYFGCANDGILEFNKTYSSAHYLEESFLSKLLLYTKEENSIFNYAFRKNSLYFHIKSEKTSRAWLDIFEKLKAETIIVYPVFCQRELKGVYLLITEEKDYLNHNFKCYATEYLLSQLVLLINTQEVSEDTERVHKNLFITDQKRKSLSKHAERYLDKEVLEKYIFNHGLKESPSTSERKRILTLCLDLRLLTKENFNDMEILYEFYNYIFPEFVKIAKNYEAKIDCLSAERLVVYWEEGENNFKYIAKHATYMAMELRELLSLYFSMRLQKNILQVSKMRILLFLSYATFTIFGNGNHKTYTYYSHEGEVFFRRAAKYPGNIIVCDAAVQLLLKNEVSSEVIEDEITQNKFYLLILSQKEKKNEDEYTRKINDEIITKQNVGFSKKIQDFLNPSHKNLSEWCVDVFTNIFTSKNIDSNVRYMHDLRWAVVPFLIGIAGLLYAKNALTPFLIFLLFFSLLLKFIENFVAVRASDPLKQERISTLMDSAMVGFWTGYVGMPLLLLYFTCYVIAYPALWYGVRFLLNTLIVCLVAIFLGMLFQGSHIETVYPVFYDIYFWGLLLALSISISTIMYVYKNIIESVNNRAKTQKGNIMKAIELIHDERYMSSEGSLNNILSVYFNHSLDIKAALYYKMSEDKKFWLDAAFCHYISHEDKETMRATPLSALGDDNIFMNTYKQGELYFQLFEKEKGNLNKNLLEIKNILKTKQLIIYPLSSEKESYGLMILGTDAENIMNDNLKLIPLTLAAAGFSCANDSIRLQSGYQTSNDCILKIEQMKTNLYSSVRSILQEEVVSFIFDPAQAEEKKISRKRLVTLYVNLSAFSMVQDDASYSLKEFYHSVFNEYYELIKKHKGKVDKVSCDSLVAYWDESEEFTFKELTKAAILFANEFRDFLQALETQYQNMILSYRTFITTNYVSFGSFGNEQYTEYTFINPTLRFLVKYVNALPKRAILCDEATYLIVKDSAHVEALPETEDKQKVYFIVVNEQDKEVFKDTLAVKKHKD